MSSFSVLEQSLTYHHAGLCVIPVKADGSKAPDLATWTQYQTRCSTEKSIREWFGQQGGGRGTAIVCGASSGNLAVFDIEFDDFFDEFMLLVEAERPGLIPRLPLVRTPGKDPSGGRHLYGRTAGSVPKCCKLARITQEEAERRTGDKGKTTAIEVKGLGGYVLAPGCPAACHPSGRTYEHIGGPPITQTPILDSEEMEILCRCARALGRTEAVAEAATREAELAARRARLIHTMSGDRPGDLFNRRGTWEEAFGASGWKVDRSRGDTVYWTRPGKDRGISASTGHCSSQQSGDLLYVFSSNAEPLQEGHCYSKFSVLAVLQHGGDYRAAALALADRGYRSERPRTQRTAEGKNAEEQQQEEEDCEHLAELLDLLTHDPNQCVRVALEQAAVLARLKADDPARWEAFLYELNQSGVTARVIGGLRTTVNQIAKDAKKQRERERQARAVEQRVQRSAAAGEVRFGNFTETATETENGKPQVIRTGCPLPAIAQHLNQIAGGWPKRIQERLFAEDDGHRPLWLDTPPGLFAWVARQLPPSDANPIQWAQGVGMASEGQLHSFLSQTVERFEDLELFPHQPPIDRHYYLHPELPSSNGRHLDNLLRRFCPATNIDGDLIRAFFLTLVWGGLPGSRPAFIFTNQTDNPMKDKDGGRGIGKSSVPQMAGKLTGGYIGVSKGADYERLMTRILSPESQGKRLLLLDNVKDLKLSWEELESTVTATELSGYRLYYGEGRRPNVLTIAITVNGVSVSKDMASRSIFIEMARPEYSETWKEDISAYIEEHRWAIVADIVAELKKEPRKLGGYSRWGQWEAEVLARASFEPAEAMKTIAERRGTADGDRSEAEMIRSAFVAELRCRKHNPDRERIFIRSQVAGEIVERLSGKRRGIAKACAYLVTHLDAIEELRTSSKDGERGYCWSGRFAGIEGGMSWLNPLPVQPVSNGAMPQ